MAVIQIPRLRSQINAIIIHYADTDAFLSGLRSFFGIYSQRKSTAALYESDRKTMLYYGLPEVVENELEIAFKGVAKNHPNEAVEIADHLWREQFFESRKLAIILVSALDSPYSDLYLRRMDQWIQKDLDEHLFNEILQASNQIPYLTVNEKWISIINSWLHSDSKVLIQYGLQALCQLVKKKEFQNLPFVFSLMMPVFSQPILAMQKELMALIKTLVHRTPSETASFLISMAEIYPSQTMLAFIRKCIPLFDEFFQQELRRVALK